MRFSNFADSAGFISSKFSKCSLLLITALAGAMFAGMLHAAPPARIGTPEWTVPSTISTDDGYADLQWEKPSGAFAELYRITESRPGNQTESYVDRPGLYVYRVEPGWYDFKIAACKKTVEGLPECGSNSAKLRLTVTDEILNELQQFSSEPLVEAMAAAVAGGPDQLRPGNWHNLAKDGHGWSFNWANRLALPESDPLFGNAYDLVGIYYTYEAKTSNIDNYRPFVVTLKAVKTGSNIYGGTIYVVRNGIESSIGSAEITFGTDNTNATIDWSINFKYESLSDIDALTLLLGSDPTSINNQSHRSGIWGHPTDNSYFVDNGIGDTAEVAELVFYDVNGDPVWVQAVNSGTAIANTTYLCFSYLTNGYAADSNTPAGYSKVWHDSGCDSSQAASYTNRNASRRFFGLEQERFWADFTLPGSGYSTGTVSIGASNSTVNLEKRANFHGINYDYVGGASCAMTNATPSCTAQITWFTDGDYPNATAYAYNQTTSVRTKILTSTEPAMENQSYAITDVGDYVFELRMGNSTSAERIAKSDTFTVTSNLTPDAPLAPEAVHGVWDDKASVQYSLRWAHIDTQTVDQYEVEETLPDETIQPVQTVSPGTSLSLALDKSAAQQGHYRYRIRACNAGGCSAYSDTLNWYTADPTAITVFTDYFESALGWTTNAAGTDTASRGMWERANPAETSSSGVIYQLGTTVTGAYDLVTAGLAGSSYGSYDVDSGFTTITSPSIAVPVGGVTTLRFHYYLAHRSSAESIDYFRAYADTPSGDVLLLEERASLTTDAAVWEEVAVDLTAFAGQDIQIRFKAADKSGTIIEAAVDDLDVLFFLDKPVVPEAVHGVWTDKANSQYTLQWLHTGMQTVDLYEIEETLPDETVQPVQTVSPGTSLSLAFDKSTAQQGHYQYRIRACNVVGCSDYSNTLNWYTADPSSTSVWTDDFETSKGWITNPDGTDSANTGRWERADPVQTSSSGGSVYQLGDTVSGTYDLVTEGDGSSHYSDDIDGGITTVISPTISVPIGGITALRFHYYLAHSSSAESQDFFRTYANTPSGDILLFEELASPTTDTAAWEEVAIDLTVFAGQDVQIRFEAADYSGTIIEAAVDDLDVLFFSTNNQPVISPVTSLTFIQGVQRTVNIAVSDADGDTLSCSVSPGSLPDGLTLSPEPIANNCVISGTPTAAGATFPIVLDVSDGIATASAAITIEVFELDAVTELAHIWVDEGNRLFKLAWRYPEQALGDTYRTPAYYMVSPGSTQPEGTVLPADVAIGANVGNRMWQSESINETNYVGSTYWVAACIGENLCGPQVALNLLTAQESSDLESVGQLSSAWINEATGTFTLSWIYDADYFGSSTGKPDYFEITPSLDLSVLPIIVTVGSPPTLSWQSGTIDEDDHVGSSYIVKACKNSGDCGPSMIMALSRQLPDLAFPTPVWNHGNVTVDESLRFSLDWQSALDTRIDYFTIEEQGVVGTSVFYTEAESIALERAAVGSYTFRVKACDRDRENGDSCGAYSSSVTITVPSSFVQMEQISDLNWFWVDEPNNLIALNWQYPSAAYDTSNGRPDYFAVSFSGGFSLDHSVDASNGDGDYIWISNTMDLDSAWTQGTFSVSACVNGGTCGSPVSIDPWTVPAGAPVSQSSSAQVLSQEAIVSASVLGGPDDFKPGSWWDPDRAGTGWDFFWASELRYPGTHDNYGNTYDLMAFWYAYQIFKDENGQDIWLPVWFYSELKLVNDDEGANPHYSGTLYYPTQELDAAACGADNRCAVGQLEVYINPDYNTKADVNVTINADAGLAGISDALFELSYIGADTNIFVGTNPENPHDHFSGMWTPDGASGLLEGNFATSHWIESWFEAVSVVHYDQNGLPIWTRASIDGRPPELRDGDPLMDDSQKVAAVNAIHDDSLTFEAGSVYTISSGFDPVEERNDQNPAPTVTTISAGSGRRLFEDHSTAGDGYEGHRKAGIWLDLDYTLGSGAGIRTVDLSVGTIETPMVMNKWSNFHDIRFYVGGDFAEPSECPIFQYSAEASSSCDLRLNWFTDSEYPNITAFLHNLDTDQYTKIASPGEGNAAYPVTTGYPYSISQPGTYQMELWKHSTMDPNTSAPDISVQGNAQIAVSRELTVIDEGSAGVNEPDSPTFPPNDPSVPVFPATDGVGATAGSFRVDESGSATYTIPILTAPSTGNLRPDIALAYSSGLGNGPVGVGWQITGTSTITRCSQTLTQDIGGTDPITRGINMTASDRFCLDGVRLMLTSGAYGGDEAEYRLETDTTVRIRSYGSQGSGPKSFTVWRGNGSVSHYGDWLNSSASQDSVIGTHLGDQTQPQPAAGWAIDRVYDRANNFMTFDYADSGIADGGYSEHRLVGINYADHGNLELQTNNRLEFVYGSRPDVKDRYMAGRLFRLSKKLTQINSFGVNEPQRAQSIIRSYKLNYDGDGDGLGRSALQSIQECNGSVCFNQTDFTWNRSSVTFAESNADPAVYKSPNGVFQSGLFDARPADINGDGRLDLVWLKCDSYNYGGITEYPARLFYALANEENGFDARFDAGRLSTYTIGFCDPTTQETLLPPVWTTADYNNDGMTDIIILDPDSAIVNSGWVGLASNGVGFVEPTTDYQMAQLEDIGDVPFDPYIGTYLKRTPQFGDFNGDGLVDVLAQTTINNGSGTRPHLYMQLNNGTAQPFNSPHIEIDFDAIPLPAGVVPPIDSDSVVMEFSTRKGFSTGSQVVDYNNDGTADLLVRMYLKNSSDTVLWAGWVVLISDGEGRFSDAVWVRQENNVSIAESDVHLVDINGDALADMVWLPPSADDPTIKTCPHEYGYRINKGNGFGSEVYLNGLSAPGSDCWAGVLDRMKLKKRRDSASVQFVDYDGDMDMDILFPTGDGTDSVYSVLRWEGDAFSGQSETTQLISREIQKDGDQSMFVDMTGDGFIDQLFFQRDNGALDYVKMKTGYDSIHAGSLATDYTLERYEPQNVITKVTNGFGDFVEIEYQSLTQSEVHQRASNARFLGWETTVFDVIWPNYVVNKVSTYILKASPGSEGGVGATSDTLYAYKGARVQSGGRGLLGFSEIISFEVNSGVRTATRYLQGFPYTGLPFDTERSLSNLGAWKNENSVGICTDPIDGLPDPCESPLSWGSTPVPDHNDLISYVRNRWGIKTLSPTTEVYMPVAAQSLEITYITPGQKFSSQSVINTHDFYGNVLTSNVTEDEWRDADWVRVSSSTTTNKYEQDSISDTLWVLGLVTSNQQTLARTGESSKTLVSKFEYKTDTTNGILEKETTDFNGEHEVVIEYAIDIYGNYTSKKVSPSLDDPRQSATTSYGYDSLHRYRQTTTNADYQIVAEVIGRDAFGNPLETLDINDVSTYYGYDAMGRQFYAISQTGAWTQESQYWTGNSVGQLSSISNDPNCPVAAIYAVKRTSATEPTSWTCYDAQARVIRVATTAFGGGTNKIDTGYDSLGRVAYVSVPYSGTGAVYTHTSYDVYNRPKKVDYPDARVDNISYGAVQTCDGGTQYYGTSQTQTNTTPVQLRTEIHDVNGNRLCVIDEAGGITAYGYDAANNINRIDGPLPNEPGTQDILTINYNARGWKTDMSDPDKGYWEYKYYPTGELRKQIDGNGQVIEYTYDILGQVKTRTDKMTEQASSIEEVQTTFYQYTNSKLVLTYICKGLQDGCVNDNQPYRQTFDYDGFGRVKSSETTINRIVLDELKSEKFETKTVYDGVGRVFQEFETFMHPFRPHSGLQYNYKSNGYLKSLQETRGGSEGLQPGTIFQEVTAMDAWGNVVASVLGNGVEVEAAYDPLTGRITGASAGYGIISVQELYYEWDLIGNLKEKLDVTRDTYGIVDHQQKETYIYDRLNRLETVTANLGASDLITMSLDYDEAGNITSKAGLSYTYGSDSRPNGAGPHAVSTYDGITYHYDINGNNTSSNDGRLITYTSYNKPSRIELGSNASEFFYGPNRSRYRRVETINDQIVEEAFYIGNTEIIDRYDGTGREYRRNIGGIAIERFSLSPVGSASEKTDYVLTDNLGSPHTLLDELGQISYQVGFDPHGSRREGDDPSALILGSNPLEDVTDRGFTGHEHLDVLGVIHMNGRIYDPKLGRFLQADPLIQDLSNSQSLNRYTYVFNNPLAYTDPSGYGAFSKYIRPILSIGVAWASGGWAAGLFQAGNIAGALAVSVGGGALAGAIATGSGKGALLGAFTGAMAFGVGATTAGSGWGQISNRDAREGAQSATGGFRYWVSGSNFGSGVVTSSGRRSSKIRVHGLNFTSSLEEIRSTAKGKEILDYLEANNRLVSLNIYEGGNPFVVDGEKYLGLTRATDLTLFPSLWEGLFGAKPDIRFSLNTYINMNVTDPTFFKANGEDFIPSLTRVMAHEIAHAYVRAKGFVNASVNVHEAVAIENEIALQLNPNAIIRHATKGHGAAFKP